MVKKILVFAALMVLSACASLDNVQYYDGPAKDRSSVAVFTASFPVEFRRINLKNYTECGKISINGSFPGYSFELLPGSYSYRWTGVDGQYSRSVEGRGQITVAANEVYVLACGSGKYYVLKMPFKLTDTKINERVQAK